MSVAAIAIPAITAVVIQGIQAWMAMAKLAGIPAEEVQKVFDAELVKFLDNTPDKLPD